MFFCSVSNRVKQASKRVPLRERNINISVFLFREGFEHLKAFLVFVKQAFKRVPLNKHLLLGTLSKAFFKDTLFQTQIQP